MIIYEPPKAPNKIPLIDISDFYSNDLEKQKSIAWELHKAARETGFFYVAYDQWNLGAYGIASYYSSYCITIE